MPKNNQNFNQELEGFLREFLRASGSGSNNLMMKDVDGDDVPSAKEADQFIFQYSKNGKDHGNVVITTHGGKVSVYYNQNLNRGPDGSDTGWTKFLMKLKDWALRNGQMEFKASNIDNIGYEMKKRKQQKREENLSEGYYGTRHTSYSDNTPKIKMIIKHSKSIDEGDQRYRYIDKIFLENELGERVLIPTKKPSVGRAFARHLAEGGQYNDERWKHIREIAEDISSLSGFVRATKTKQFNEGVMQVVNEAANHYQQLRETIKKLQNSRGYNMYFENWQPQLMEQDTDQDFSSMFVSNRLDPRIEQALPVLNKLNIKVNEIQEATEFEQWANSIVEGQSPAMDHKVKEFAKLLSEPDSLPVGADAMNVKGQLEDLIDDQDHRNALFDELDDLAYSDPDNDSIPTIISFLQKHKDEKFYGEVLDHVGEKTDIPSDQEIATEPETATQASAPATPPAPQTPAAPASGAAGAAAPFMPQPLAEKAKKPVQRNFVAKHAQRSGAGSHGKKGFQRHDKHKKKLGEEVVTEGYSELDNLQKKFEATIERILQRAKEEGRGPDQLNDREKKAIAILKGKDEGVAEGIVDDMPVDSMVGTMDKIRGDAKSQRYHYLQKLLKQSKNPKTIAKINALLAKEYPQDVSEGSIKDAEQALARHGQYKVDHEKKYGPMSGADLHQHEVMRNQLLDKKRRAQSAYAKKQGVAEGSEPQVGDEVYYGNRLVGTFKGYSKLGKIITEPNVKEMGDEYLSKDAYWDPQPKITIKPKQGVAEGGILKSIKRGLQGWDKNAVGPGGEKLGDPRAIVKRAKAMDIDTAKKVRAGLDAASDHSPAGLQKRVLDRKLKDVSESSEDPSYKKGWKLCDKDPSADPQHLFRKHGEGLDRNQFIKGFNDNAKLRGMSIYGDVSGDVDHSTLHYKEFKRDQGVAEDQLDELKCWDGYKRVPGTTAGAPGSCEKINEFSPGGSGGDDILKTLAAQWLNGDVSSGDLDSDIQSQEKIERRLEKGVTCPDGVKRKLYIDYNEDYDGVVIYGDDDWSIEYKQDDLNESKIDESLSSIKRLSGLK